MVKFKEEKGSTTLFVLIAMIFFVMYLVGMYMLTANSEASQVAENARIKEIYEEGVNNIDDVYATLENANRLATQITPANYGDYVNYEDGLDLGSSAYGHTTDWRIFYKDNDGYVYLISSYYLPYNLVPTGTNLISYSGRPYTAYWSSAPSSYTSEAEISYARYMMNFKYNGSHDNGYDNMKCVSQLMNTSVWNTKFKNSTYAEDVIGSPTLEMWIDSWNAKGNTTLYYNNSNEYGYYIGTTSLPNTTSVSKLSTSNSLYHPVTTSTKSDANGYGYWLTSPSAANNLNLILVSTGGDVRDVYTSDYKYLSVRPVVRLKNTISATKDANGIWQLEQ